MKILITSVSSFVGRYIARKLLIDGHQVTGSYRRDSDYVKKLVKQYGMKTIQNNFSISSEIKTLKDNFDVIINSSGAFTNGKHLLEDIISLNIKNSYFISEQSIRQKSLPKIIINFSTLSIYGDLRTKLINDNNSASPSCIYGSSKLVGEDVLSYLIGKKLPIINIRLPAILGKGSHTAWLPVLIEKMLKNENIKIYNPKSYYYACTTLDNLYKFTNNLINSKIKNDTFSFPVGAKSDLTINQITNLLKDELNSFSKISVEENNFPCCKIESKKAERLGYEFPLTSYCINYLLRNFK